MSGRVGVEQTPDIETVLTKAFHRDATFGHGAVDTAAECGACRDIMQALAPVLVAAVREARAAAWDEGSATEAVEAAEIVRQGRDGFLGSDGLDPAWIAGWHAATDHHESRLRDRADRIAVDAPEGGEGGPAEHKQCGICAKFGHTSDEHAEGGEGR